VRSRASDNTTNVETPVSGNAFIIDNTPPTVSSITRTDSNPTSSSSVQWTVTFSENVVGVNATDFALANIGLTSPSISTVTGSGSSYTVTASTGNGSGSLGLNLNDNDFITDAAGNKLGGTGTGTAGSGGAGNGSYIGEAYTVQGWVLVQQSAAAATYRWRNVAAAGAFGGSYTTAHLAGSKASFTFSGRSVTWYTVTGTSQGLARVLIDGVPKGTFDQYATTHHDGVARTFSGLAAGAHTISIVVKGQKGSPAGTGTYVSVDAFRTGTNLFSSPNASYSWRKVPAGGASGGSYVTSDDPGSRVTFTFTGTGVEWYTTRGPGQGKATVSIDGGAAQPVDNYAPSASFGTWWSRTGLPLAPHTVTITVLGTKRAASTGRSVAVDAFGVL